MALKATVRKDFAPMKAFVGQVNLKMLNFYTMAGTLVRNEAKDLASRKAGGGRWYSVSREKTKTVKGNKVSYIARKRYQASAPGEPPVKVWGDLWKSIHYRVEIAARTPLGLIVYKCYVGSPSKIATFLEWGTVKLKPRPFLRPALMNKLPELKRELAS